MRQQKRFRMLSTANAVPLFGAAALLMSLLQMAAQAPAPNSFSGPATSAIIARPQFMTVDPAGNIFTTDDFTRVLKVTPQGVISSIAGTGVVGYRGDGSPAASMTIGAVSNLRADNAGNVYIGEPGNGRIRRITPNGVITTVVGGGPGNAAADVAPAEAVVYATTLALDAAGNLYFGEGRPIRIRKYTFNGVVTSIAGNGTSGFSGDGGPAISAQFGQITGLAVDRSGNIFVADGLNHRIRKITPDGIIHTIAGNGTPGFSGDGGPAISAQIEVGGIAVDAAGNIYFGDRMTRVRKITLDGIIHSVAGNGTRGSAGDGGPATSAQLQFPYDVELDSAGNLYIADMANGRIRKVSPGGVISTVAGSVVSSIRVPGGIISGPPPPPAPR